MVNDDENKTVRDYLNYHETYSNIYGHDRTLVLMQVGSFYEAYATNTRGPKLSEIANTIHIICTRKDKSNSEISEKNPYLIGFNMISSQKFISLLINSGYTLVMVDQVTEPPKPERKVTNIYSPSTYIENISNQDTNYSACIYFEAEMQKNGSSLLCAGMSAVDLSTGKCYVHEAHSLHSDQNIALDEVAHFINTLNPSEIIIYQKQGQQKKNHNDIDRIISYIGLNKRNHLLRKDVDKKYFKPSFQNEFLQKSYKQTGGLLSTIEYLDLDRTDYARLSFVLLLEFAHEHNVNIINNISKPCHYMDNNHLLLANNAIHQLNIVDYDSCNDNVQVKYKCLFDIVNNTTTSLGRRFLKDRLTAPLTSHKELNKIYDDIDELLCDSSYKTVEQFLKGISDIERLQRKMALSVMHPYEMANLVESCDDVCALFDYLSKNGKLKNILPTLETVEKIKDFVSVAKRTFHMSELKAYSLNNITNTFFNDGIHKDVDVLKRDMTLGYNFMTDLCKVLCEYITDNGRRKHGEKITVKKTNGKYYLCLTKTRANILRENLQFVSSLTVNNTEFKVSQLIFDDNNKNDVKITISGISNNADGLTENENQIAELTKKYYLNLLPKFQADYNDSLKIMIKFVSYVDYIKSNAKMAALYNYKRPIIKHDGQDSFLECKSLRHPIIERIIDYEYVPHDISIGKGLKGMLIFGENSSGKTCLMKAAGIAVIMAQAGLFVAAQEFVFFPYTSLYTRITGSDNMLKGLSSFAVEMLELEAILRRAGRNTLVIGDEVCRGTEHISGNSIVAATIINLSQKGSSFMFATHLHEIASMERITKLGNVQSFHISVSYDPITGTQIYDRMLKPGPGEQVYGITFARHIIHDEKFIELTVEIKNELLNKYDDFVTGKTSRYNADLYVHECQLCGKTDQKCHISPLETHHIKFQKDCENGFSKDKPHIKKNSKANLIVLCNECHDRIHRDDINIDGYVMTSQGRAVIVKDKSNKKILVNQQINEPVRQQVNKSTSQQVSKSASK
jgi:DNA mismatch repair protein MutS